jgi:hypothetical protein
LTQYQGGLKMAQYFEKNQVSTQNLFMPLTTMIGK